jgi:hypothetical protein
MQICLTYVSVNTNKVVSKNEQQINLLRKSIQYRTQTVQLQKILAQLKLEPWDENDVQSESSKFTSQQWELSWNQRYESRSVSIHD